MEKELNILIIEDNDDDLFLLVRYLKKNGYKINYEQAFNEEAVRELLNKGGWDLVISDYSMPQFNGLRALEIFKEFDIDIPFILLSGTIGEDVAVEAMKMGAHDYLMKDKLSRLVPAIERELSEAKIRSERRDAVRKLKESEENYRKIFENALDIIFKISAEGKVISVNKVVETILGWDSVKDLNRNLLDFVHPDDHNIVLSKQRNTLNGIKNDEYTVRLLKKDGSFIYGAIKTTLLTKDGEIEGILGFVRDVTKDREMRERITIFSKASNQSPVSIIITDLEGKISYVNEKFKITSGFTEDDFSRMSTKEIIAPELTDEEYMKIWLDVSNYGIWKGEFYGKNRNNVIVWEDVSISPIKDDAGNVIRYLIIKIDITKRKEMFSELIVAKKEAESANKVKSEFLAQMSHEIRTPLNTMLSFHQLIKSDLEGKLDEDLLSCLVGAEKASQRIIRTIDLILNMTEVQVGSYNIHREIIDIYDVVLEDLVLEKAADCKAKGLKLNLVKSTEDTSILVDRYSVTQIFENLISNAIKYTPSGEININCFTNDNGSLAVSISDTGIGISKANQKKIFTAFAQVENGYTRSYEGNGLGLALVKEYCKLNRATISVESEVGKGSRFIVEFKF